MLQPREVVLLGLFHEPARLYSSPGARGNECLQERRQVSRPALGCSRRGLSPRSTQGVS